MKFILAFLILGPLTAEAQNTSAEYTELFMCLSGIDKSTAGLRLVYNNTTGARAAYLNEEWIFYTLKHTGHGKITFWPTNAQPGSPESVYKCEFVGSNGFYWR